MDVLHNFVRKKDGVRFEDESYECPLQTCHPTGTRANRNGLYVRDYFSNYFISPQGSIPGNMKKFKKPILYAGLVSISVIIMSNNVFTKNKT